ncbi:MAG TPA: tetratricopeptide repeat protein [Gemmataceae bacterium]|jgi:tetratricopeptide (TPR) repeat protein|nr:tetratricopeptide repeat protein [Gemmataceae bacterium]
MKKFLIVLGLLIVVAGAAGALYVQRTRSLANDIAQARELLETRQGKELIARLAARFPSNAEVQFLRCRQLALDADLVEAQLVLGQAAALGYPNDQVRRERWILTAFSNFRQAESYLQEMLAANKDDRDVAMSLARGYMQAHKLRTAESLVGPIIQRNPADGEALCLRARIRLLDSNTVRAADDARKALALGEDKFYHFAARMLLAECMEKLTDRDGNNLRRAYELYKLCKAERPSNSQAVYQFAQCAIYMERLDEALAAFNEFLELRPGNVDALLQISNIRISKKEYEEALKILKAVELQYPDDPQVLAQLAKIYTLLDRPDKAKEYGKRHEEWIKRLEEKNKDKQTPAPETPPK